MKIALSILFIFVLSFSALSSFFSSPYLPLFHDQVQSERVYDMAGAIAAGQIPPRMVQNLGYGFGYPLFNYYAPFPYYVGALFFFLGSGLILSTKVMIALAFILAGATMWYACSRIWGVRGGMLSTVLYLLAPYHAVQLYVRGSVGEMWTYALLPLVVLGLIEVYKEKISKQSIVLGMSAVFLVSISHTVSLFMFAILWVIQFFLGVICVMVTKQEVVRFIKRSLIFISLPLLLSAFYWMPALLEIDQTQVSIESGNDVKYTDHFITVSQLWSSPWGFGGSTKGIVGDGMSFMIGKVLIVLALASLVLALVQKKLFTHTHRKTVYALAGFSSLTVSIMLESSNSLWQTLPYAQLIQFPWRFIMITTCLLSFMAPGVLTLLSNLPSLQSQRIIYTVILAGVSVYQLFPSNFKDFPQTKYFFANGWYAVNEAELQSKEHVRFDASRISDEYLPKAATRPTSIENISRDEISCTSLCTITDMTLLPHIYSFEVSTPQDTKVSIDKSFYPNFKVRVNGSEKEILLDEPNKMSVNIAPGESRVEFYLTNTTTRNIANAITVSTFIFLLIYTSVLIGRNRAPKGKA